MAICDVLNEVIDFRKSEDGSCAFNGFLEDYLSLIEDDDQQKDLYTLLSPLFEKDNNLKIICDLQLSVNRSAIANQIIRYKDAFKLPKGAIKVPYLIYGSYHGQRGPTQKAMILTLGDKEAYIMAKSLYYVMSEPDNEFEGTRNEIIASVLSKDGMNQTLQAIDNFFMKDAKAGNVQRNLDMAFFSSYDEMYELAYQICDTHRNQIETGLEEAEDTEAFIYHNIATWFLMKKFTYVQYMMDKNTLTSKYEGNVKKQRQTAKEKSDAISFVSFSQMWRMKKK